MAKEGGACAEMETAGAAWWSLSQKAFEESRRSGRERHH